VAAVIDKDYASSLLARSIQADLFLISTAVEKVYLNYNKPNQQAIDRMTLAQAKQYMAEGHFAKGSMLPKIQAIIWFLEAGGKEAHDHQPARTSPGRCGARPAPESSPISLVVFRDTGTIFVPAAPPLAQKLSQACDCSKFGKGERRGTSLRCSCFSSQTPQASRRSSGAPPWFK
jgi:hypothetical protein